MTRIFISYRREDSQWPADRLHQALKPVVADPRKDIFIDVDNIPLGVDFADHLGAQVGQCDILLAMIGRGWVEARNPKTGQRRLDDPKDFVRIEISTALKRGIRVVPILVDGAAIPREEDLPGDLQPLAKRNGMDLQRISFDADVARLIRGLGLEEVPQSSKLAAKPPAKQPPGKLMLWGCIALAVSVPAIFTTLLYVAAPRAEGEVPPDFLVGMILVLLSQPILGWLGCILVAKAVSHRPYWLLALLTFVTCGPVGAALWFFGAGAMNSELEYTTEQENIAAILIASLAALGAGLTAYLIGRLIRKKSPA
jgi:hypothetical protein